MQDELKPQTAEQELPRLAAWVIKYEIPLFFILAFAFSWTIYLLLSRSHIGFNRWTHVAAFGPSVAAMLLARLTGPQREKPRPIQHAILFVLAFAAAFGVEWLDHKWWYHQIGVPLIISDVILVFLAALVISGVLSSRRGVRNLLQGLTRWRVGAGWYILALGLWPALVVAANALATTLGLDVPVTPYHPTIIPIIPLIVESFFWYLLFGGPLNEEVGWRAFGLTRLQRRFSPLIASVIVGALWGLWHLPLHLMGLYPMGAQGAIIRIFSIPLAIVFTWLFNRTRQSLLLVLLLHASINTTSLFQARNYITSSVLLTLLAVVLVFTDKMWRSPEGS
jgi:membrane protease YdiL (CAAX protease family)